MLASNLPFEILAQIASFLPKADRYHCSLTCSGWKLAFQNSLWEFMEINCQNRLIYMCESSHINIYRVHGHLTRELSISKDVKLGYKHLVCLQKHFPNLLHIKIPGGINIIDKEVPNDWEYWRYLQGMRISMPVSELQHPRTYFYTLVSYLPNLSRLEYIERENNRVSPFTMKSFELLHSYTPNLEYISMSIQVNAFTSINTSSLSKVLPANRITVSKFEVYSPNHEWLCYIAHKYPKLHTLELTPRTNGFHNELYRNEADAMFAKLPFAFPNLENFKIFLYQDMRQFDYNVWKLIHQFNIPLRRVTRVSRFMITDDQVPDVLLTNLLGISLQDPSSAPSTMPASLAGSLFSSLVELRLKSHLLPIKVNLVLDCFPALKVLELDGRVDGSASSESTQHGLQLISLAHCIVKPSFFTNLSSRCRDLKYMFISDTDILGHLDQNNGRLVIDMPYTDLKYLGLHYPHFYWSHSPSSTTCVEIHMLSINQQAHSTKPVYNKKSISPSSGDPGPLESIWMYFYCNSSSYDLTTDIWLVSEEDSEYCRKYAKDFGSVVMFDFIPNLLIAQPPTQYGWLSCLVNGHVTINCRKIGDYTIDNLPKSTDVFLDQIRTKLTQ
ncbi:hypothetical protein CLU79DRAFT_778375 [Phycomyces nitens]|nr:hypothetical protein CLU79DRAFT_778375 [Phycomyces nitens]